MKSQKIVLLATGSILSGLAFASLFQPMALKPGAWEITTKNEMAGAMFPAEMLNKMSPAQRKQFEAQMGNLKIDANGITTKTCITMQQLTDPNYFAKQNRNQDCQTTVLKSSPTLAKIAFTCTGKVPQSGTGVFMAPNSNTYRGVIDSTSPKMGKMHIEFAGKWLSPSCAGIKPIK